MTRSDDDDEDDEAKHLVRLRVQARGGEAQIYEFRQPEMTIGRASHATLQLRRESNASRVHCRLYFDGDDRLHIVDNRSSNGTFVNGEPIDDVLFVPGDRLVIGDIAITRLTDD